MWVVGWPLTDLPGNHIMEISGLMGLPCLSHLTLASNRIEQISNLTDLPLKYLNLVCVWVCVGMGGRGFDFLHDSIQLNVCSGLTYWTTDWTLVLLASCALPTSHSPPHPLLPLPPPLPILPLLSLPPSLLFLLPPLSCYRVTTASKWLRIWRH